MNPHFPPSRHARLPLGILLCSGICLGACTPPYHPKQADPRALPAQEPVRIDPTEPLASPPAEPPASTISLAIDPPPAAEPSTSETPVAEPEPIASVPPADAEPQTNPSTNPGATTAPDANLDEVVALYRRLHTELDAAERSALITELLSDPRRRILELGFELAHRNLSARTPLSPSVGETTTKLLSNPIPSIRGQAAGLLTRLVTPDAMLQLTEALNRERDPTAAEPMLLGVARWPNPDATDAVVSWFIRDDAPFDAAASAAWAFERAGLLSDPPLRAVLLNAMRAREPEGFALPAMKLFATLGDAQDLQNLAELLSAEDTALRDRAAAALAETPRATELLARAAESNPALYRSAGEALIRHRPTPAGLRRLAKLNAPDPATRTEMLLRMSEALPVESLGEGVALAELDDPTAARLLERLLSGEEARSPRALKGIMQLAEIEFRLGRPDQALDIADSIAPHISDPIEQTKLTELRQQAAITAGVFDHTSLGDSTPPVWFGVLETTRDPQAKRRIARRIADRFEAHLSDEQLAQIHALTTQRDDAEEPAEPQDAQDSE